LIGKLKGSGDGDPRARDAANRIAFTILISIFNFFQLKKVYFMHNTAWDIYKLFCKSICKLNLLIKLFF
jgi:hypothetical protein